VEGQALSPEETAAVSKYVREHGIDQFLNTWRRVKDIQNDELKFGDEIECGVFTVDSVNKTVKVSVRSKEVKMRLVA
jgi:glutamate--cysteine ligase catalytic subunit